MIKDPMLSTKDAPTRYGGLLICGANYGLAAGAAPEQEAPFEPWGEYFTHESNRRSDRFVSRLATWFDWWRLPLERGGHPTALNLAISQTNLFYDTSASFAVRDSAEMELAFTRLKKNATRLNASGILLASARAVDHAKDHFDLPEWQYVSAGRFWIGFSTSSFRVAVCPHPASPQSQANVECVGREMRNWISETMTIYRERQASRNGA